MLDKYYLFTPTNGKRIKEITSKDMCMAVKFLGVKMA